MAPQRTRPSSLAAGSNGHKTDIVLPMNQPYMGQIVSGVKTYEFRKYHISKAVKRVWFYVTAPESRITHICEIAEARTRKTGDEPLPLDGLGNKEYNERHPDWNGYDFAYEILSVYELKEPIALEAMKRTHGFKGAPRGLVYATLGMIKDFPLKDQKTVIQRHA